MFNWTALIWCAWATAALAQLEPSSELAPADPPAAESTGDDAAANLAASQTSSVRVGDDNPAEATPKPLDAAPIVDYLVTARLGRYGRGPLHIDSIAASMARGEWRFPAGGDEVIGFDGVTRQWQAAAAEADGWIRHDALRGGYAAAAIQLPADQTFLLEASGHVMAYVNGEPRAGDPYRTGRTTTPVRLQAGRNELLFHVAGGELFARLAAPSREVSIDMRDAKLPDLVVGDSKPVYGATLVVNARDQPLRSAELTTIRPGGRKVSAAVPPIPPFGVRQVIVPIDSALTQDEAKTDAVRVQMDLTLPEDDADASRRIVDSAAFDLAVVQAGQLQMRTHLSDVDGSVQSYAFLPAAFPPQPPGSDVKPALLIALHSAGESSRSLLDGLSPLAWAHIAAPEGRRPVGFDWEDWSRIDALEAIGDVRRRDGFDEQRASLAGAGSGGHGALRIAALQPDRFASIASFGGWLSYHTYGDSVTQWTSPNQVEKLLARCADASQTLPLLPNLAPVAIHIQHDAADPDVPLSQARTLRSRLAEFHGDFAYRETLGDQQIAPLRSIAFGQAPAEFLFSRRTPRREQVEQVELTTFNLSASSRNQWMQILQQERQYEQSSVSITCDMNQREFRGITDNVAALALDVSHLAPGGDVAVQLDGQRFADLTWPAEAPFQLTFLRRDDRWSPSPPLSPRVKTPRRYGGFRTAWGNRVALVYGTRGAEDENAWSLAKARFDAETFLVRGSAAVDVVADVDFRPSDDPDRNVVLYGNLDANAAWPKLLSTSPVQVRSGRVVVGPRSELGDDVAVLMIRPRRDGDRSVVAAIGGTGIEGMRATDRLPLFVSGVTFPDFLMLSADALDQGSEEILAAGFFGLDWSVENGDIAWRDTAL